MLGYERDRTRRAHATYTHTSEAVVEINADAGTLLDLLDDHGHLGSHMEEPSKIRGGRMTYALDEGEGRALFDGAVAA